MTLKQALLCIRDVETEYTWAIFELGLIAVLERDDHTDWYVFASTENLSDEHAALLHTMLSERGARSEYFLNDLSAHRNVLFMSAGGFDQIMKDLEVLGQSQRDLREKVQLN